MRPIKELARRHVDDSPGTIISGTPREAMGGQWSLAAYFNVSLCQFFPRERTRHLLCFYHINARMKCYKLTLPGGYLYSLLP